LDLLDGVESSSGVVPPRNLPFSSVPQMNILTFPTVMAFQSLALLSGKPRERGAIVWHEHYNFVT